MGIWSTMTQLVRLLLLTPPTRLRTNGSWTREDGNCRISSTRISEFSVRFGGKWKVMLFPLMETCSQKIASYFQPLGPHWRKPWAQDWRCRDLRTCQWMCQDSRNWYRHCIRFSSGVWWTNRYDNGCRGSHTRTHCLPLSATIGRLCWGFVVCFGLWKDVWRHSFTILEQPEESSRTSWRNICVLVRLMLFVFVFVSICP